MKVPSLYSIFITGFFLSCCFNVPSNLISSTEARADEEKAQIVERDYLVKGMTCAGCVFGVKKALERAGIERSQILEVDYRKPDPDHKVGHAKIRFPKGQHKGEETDCKIVKAIRDNPGYVAYLDASNTNPCKFGK